MKPRILFLDHTAALGGAELSLLDLARSYRSSSHVLLFDDGPFRAALGEAGVSVEILPAPEAVAGVRRDGQIVDDLRAIPGVLKLARQVAAKGRAYDVLYANSQKSMIVAAIAGAWARRPVIWHLRDMMTEEHFSRMHCRVVALISNLLVTRVIANSEATRMAYLRQGGKPDATFYVHNGVDQTPFEEVAADRVEQLRSKMGFETVKLVGVFSRLAQWKGQHVLVEALGRMPEVHALLVGDALFDGDRMYLDELHSRVEELGLEDRVHFLGFRRDVPALMRMVDVIAHTSIAPEPFGRVIVEGMFAGRPVVATSSGGARELIEDGLTGRLVPPGDPDALAGVLQELFNDPAHRRRLSVAGRQHARDHFTVEAMLEELDRHVSEVAGYREVSSKR